MAAVIFSIIYSKLDHKLYDDIKSNQEHNNIQAEKEIFQDMQEDIEYSYMEVPIPTQLIKLFRKQEPNDSYTYENLEKDLLALARLKDAGQLLNVQAKSSDVRNRAIAVSLDTRLFEGRNLPEDFLQNEAQPFVLSSYLIAELIWGSKDRWERASKILANRFTPESALNLYLAEDEKYFNAESLHQIESSFQMRAMYLQSGSSDFLLQSLYYNSPIYKDYYSGIINYPAKQDIRKSITLNSALSAPFITYRTPLSEESFPALKIEKIELLDLKRAATVRIWKQ